MLPNLLVVAAALLVGLSTVGAAGDGAGAAHTKGTLVAFVAAEDEDRLVAFDLSPPPYGRRILARIAVADGPHNVAAAYPQGDEVLVTSPPAGQVTLVDASEERVVKVFAGLARPHDVELSPDRRYAYVTEERGDAVAVLSLKTRRLVRRVPVGPGPHDLAVSPDGRRVWVTHGAGHRTLTIVNSARPGRAAVIGRVDGAGAPHDIAFSPDGERVWVTYWNSPFVGAFDARSRRLLFRVRAGVLPHHVAVGERVWITDHEGGQAILLSPRTGRRLRTVEAGRGTHHVAFGMGLAVVASHDDGMIHVFVAANGKRQASYRLGRGLHGVGLVLLP